MRTPVKLIIYLLLACCLASCSPTLTEFKSEAGGFAVMTPTKLQEEVKTLETEAGPIELHLFAGQWDDFAYVIAYSDYSPEGASSPDYAEKVLNGARNGAVASAKGRLVSETPITLAGFPGRALVIEARYVDQPPATIKGRLYMVKNRLYQVTVVAPRGKAGDKVVDDFLQSFKLLGQ